MIPMPRMRASCGLLIFALLAMGLGTMFADGSEGADRGATGLPDESMIGIVVREGNAVILAPRSGVVRSIRHASGEHVAPGEEVLSIASIESESQLAAETATLRADSLSVIASRLECEAWSDGMRRRAAVPDAWSKEALSQDTLKNALLETSLAEKIERLQRQRAVVAALSRLQRQGIVRAPSSGTLRMLVEEVGRAVATGDRLARVDGDGPVVARLAISPRMRRVLNRGDTLDVRARNGGRRAKCVVEQIDDAANVFTGLYVATAKFLRSPMVPDEPWKIEERLDLRRAE